MRTIIVLASAVFLAAPQISGAAGFGNDHQVKNINVTESGYVSVTPVGSDWENPDACLKSDQFWIDPAAKTYTLNMASLYTAVATGYKVNPYFSGCFSWAGNTYPKLVALHLRNY